MRKLPGIAKTGKFFGASARGLLIAILFIASGCGTSPPVQEMSDARQAIAAAKAAGAEQSAAEDLHAAEAYLDSAQRKLMERAFAQARRDALQAKSKALTALATTESSDNDPR
ncbi:MAG: DUF4398 domain-containing protein [Proteobacteria bacterium]|nr:DUF4398 domain-containing protein [Pseudomonadota bacterium]